MIKVRWRLLATACLALLLVAAGLVGIGLALLGYGIPGFLFGPAIGRLADRLGRSRLIPAGLILAGISAAALTLPIHIAMAPVLVFTAEEVWGTRYPDSGSVHLLEWPELPQFTDEGLAGRWTELRALRARVLEAIEPLRREKVLGSGLEAEVTVPSDAPEGDLAELFITAQVTRAQGGDVTVTRTHHHKCGRCWRHLPEVAEDGALCARCDEVVEAMEASA